ncbi:MAG TPA: asparaginase [Vicinamibacterales bacterium]|nr:asparaginase [Vicinamibacterales bacterium]
MSNVVEVTRGATVESRHIVHVAVAHANRGLIASCGEARHVSFVRSAIKMFQALPLAEDDVITGLALTTEELALCTASHNGEPFHVVAARSILAKADVTDDALACGPHAPMFAPAAEALERSGVTPGRIHNNCSGKHAGMLALARRHGWPAEGYHRAAHPVQQRVLRTLCSWTGVEPSAIGLAVDGCGLPTFALPLERAAVACARLAAAAASGGPAATIVRAMTTHPEFVAGTGRLCTELMRAAGGRVFAKVGAEGYYCAGVPEQGLGIALKVADGARRASEPALLAVLHELSVLSASELGRLQAFAQPVITNTRGETVGSIRPRVALTPGSP